MVLTSVTMCMGIAAGLAGLLAAFFIFGVARQRRRNYITKSVFLRFRFLVLGIGHGISEHEVAKRTVETWIFQMKQGRAQECVFEESARIYFTPPPHLRGTRRTTQQHL